MAFKYAEKDEVIPLLKNGKLTGWRADALETNLEHISTRLSAWYPGLKKRWLQADEESDLKGLVRVMVISAAVKLTNNSQGVSSETIGPYAYSKFDSEDPSKGLFDKNDVMALERLLDAEKDKQAYSFVPKGRVGPFRPNPYANIPYVGWF